MADEADIANDAIMADIERRIALQRTAANRPPASHCDECDEPLPPARVALHLRLCIDCAQLRERTARLFWRE